MKTTKEDLLKENARLAQSNKEWQDANTARKTEFAKAFRWTSQKAYSSEESFRTPTWEEIFVELGKLLASRTFKNQASDIENLYNEINVLRQREFIVPEKK